MAELDLQSALQHHQAGHFAEAEQAYLLILARSPNRADALHLLGLIHHQTGRTALGIDGVRRACALDPSNPTYFNNLGILFRSCGELEQAIAAHQRAIALRPDYAEAYANLGVALTQAQRRHEAIASYIKAIQLRPELDGAWTNLGVTLHEIGDLSEARRILEQATLRNPRNAQAFDNLGVVLRDLKRIDEAIAAHARAIEIQPDFAPAHLHLALLLKDSNRLGEAIRVLERAAALTPKNAEIHKSLGIARNEVGLIDESIASFRMAAALERNAKRLVDLGATLGMAGRFAEAAEVCREAAALDPNFPEAFSNLGAVLTSLGCADEAIICCQKAIVLKPDYLEARSNLGLAFIRKNLFDEAIASCQQALAIDPSFAPAWTTIGTALGEAGKTAESLAAFEKAVELSPTNASAHFNLALNLLRAGDFARGLAEYEWRWKTPGAIRTKALLWPRWDGQPLNGKTILLHMEQGFGDVIQMARYVPRVAAMGGKVILACDAALERLLENLPGVHLLCNAIPSVAIDVQCPILSLPLAFSTQLETIPAETSYLAPDPELLHTWSEKCAGEDAGGKLRIGLVWAGQPGHPNDRNRSLRLQQLAPLARDNVKFYSLQKGAAQTQIDQSPAEFRPIDFTGALSDFADTAALIANLDLVISVDTAVAHLAGALGKPIWLLLPLNPDWRWLMNRTDSPWYPTMRLFRQRKLGDWTETIDEVRAALDQFCRGR